MAFQTVEKGKWASKGTPNTDTVSIHSDGASARFYITSDICERMNIGDKMFLRLAKGTDQDKGFVCITIDHSRDASKSYIVAKKNTNGAGSFSCSLNRLNLKKGKWSITPFPHRVTAMGLIVDLRTITE